MKKLPPYLKPYVNQILELNEGKKVKLALSEHELSLIKQALNELIPKARSQWRYIGDIGMGKLYEYTCIKTYERQAQ